VQRASTERNKIIQSSKDNKKYLSFIVERLKTIKPYKVILIGSHVSGETHVDSDIDLIVVTSDDYFPKSYKEKSDIYLRVSNILTDLVRKMPVDLIVYTKPMYDRFNELGSLFSKEVLQKGIVLYEAGN